jgi:hypothetical protein
MLKAEAEAKRMAQGDRHRAESASQRKAEDKWLTAAAVAKNRRSRKG